MFSFWLRLQDRGVEQRVDRDTRERDLPGLEVVALVAHDAQLVLDALAALGRRRPPGAASR